MPDPKDNPLDVDPTKVKPGEEPPAPKPGEEPPKPGEKPPEPKPGEKPPALPALEVKLEGEDVPEKLRGKTVSEALQMLAETEKTKSKIEAENAQWLQHFQASTAAATAAEQAKLPQFNPLDHFSEDQVTAVDAIVAARANPVLIPIVTGLGEIMKEFTKSMRPDFEKHEPAATKYYEQMPLEHRLNPKYGWDWCYRMAVADAMGGPKPPEAPPTPGPSSTETPGAPAKYTLTPEQKHWAKLQGLSEDRYIALMTPTVPGETEEE